jgi:hypothetical protein
MVPIKADQGQFRGKRHDLTEQIIGVFFAVYNELGYGFVESVYREAMRLALVQSGLKVGVEVPIHVNFRGSLIWQFSCRLGGRGCRFTGAQDMRIPDSPARGPDDELPASDEHRGRVIDERWN